MPNMMESVNGPMKAQKAREVRGIRCSIRALV
jgi:hypothetical protein